MKIDKYIKIVTGVYILTCIFWLIFIIYTKHSGLYEGPMFEYVLKPFLVGMTILPIIGGYFGVKKADVWGGLKSAVGRGMIFISLGTVSWGFGMVVWNYYLFSQNIEVPYPSLADLFFILIWVFWTYGMSQLGNVSGMKIGFKNHWKRIIVFIIPPIVILISYYLLLVIPKEGIDLTGSFLQRVLSFLYPIGDMTILSIAILVFTLSYKILGGRFKNQIILLLSCFVLNYIADFIFVLTTSGESPSYFNGHFVDFMYTTIMFLVTFGVLLIDPLRLSEDPSPNSK